MTGGNDFEAALLLLKLCFSGTDFINKLIEAMQEVAEDDEVGCSCVGYSNSDGGPGPSELQGLHAGLKTEWRKCSRKGGIFFPLPAPCFPLSSPFVSSPPLCFAVPPALPTWYFHSSSLPHHISPSLCSLPPMSSLDSILRANEYRRIGKLFGMERIQNHFQWTKFWLSFFSASFAFIAFPLCKVLDKYR
eukprot:767440-Hanusia_phi.AAC.4